MTRGKIRALTFVATLPSLTDALSAWSLVKSSDKATSSRPLQPGCLRGICLQVVPPQRSCVDYGLPGQFLLWGRSALQLKPKRVNFRLLPRTTRGPTTLAATAADRHAWPDAPMHCARDQAQIYLDRPAASAVLRNPQQSVLQLRALRISLTVQDVRRKSAIVNFRIGHVHA